MPHIVVCYDIVCDRRRTRLMNLLKDYLPHVQKSVFEGPIDQNLLIKLREKIRQEIDLTQDSVRIYHLCGRCLPSTEIFGLGTYIPADQRDEVI